MSKELEKRVIELIDLKPLKKSSSRTSYVAEKLYNKAYDDIMTMLKAGHKMPKDSELYARIDEVYPKQVHAARVLEAFVERYPQYGKTVRDIREELMQVKVEQLDYGLLPKQK
jgi:virulence-associated protein VapD